VLVQDDADRIHGGTQDLGGVLDRVGALADEFMQAGGIDERRVRPREVKIAEKADRRVPGDRFAPDPVPGEEVAGGLIQRCGELGRADGGEAGSFGAEMGFV
jgi:hypothetical protein